MDVKSEVRSSSKGSFNPLKDNLSSIIAFLLLVAFAFFILYLLGLTTAQETQWTRAVYLFSGAEAIAFAAAGFLFGSEIQRKRAERAEERAGGAEKLATEAEKLAIEGTTKAKALKDAIQSKLETRTSAGETDASGELYGGLGDEEAINLTDLKELSNFANRLFRGN